MMTLVIISQMMLYLCLSIMMGYWIIQFVPTTNRPAIYIPSWLIGLCTILTILCTFIPVLHVVLYLKPALGFFAALTKVVLTFDIGMAWCWTLGFGLLLLFTWKLQSQARHLMGIIFTFSIIMSIAWSSHAGTLHVNGFIGDALHLTSVSIWGGILIVVSWFSTNTQHWTKFLAWFSPLAFCCFVLTILSGFILMDVMIGDYTDSWVSSYGTGLLIKHLFIVPLILYILLNSLLIKLTLRKNTQFNPKPWAKLESVILFVLLGITAVFTQQSPPMDTVTRDQISPLFQLFSKQPIEPGMTVQLNFQLTNWLLLGCALLFGGLFILTFIKQAPRLLSLVFSVLLVFCVYLAFMASVHLV